MNLFTYLQRYHREDFMTTTAYAVVVIVLYVLFYRFVRKF